jgi:hypothetical protein
MSSNLKGIHGGTGFVDYQKARGEFDNWQRTATWAANKCVGYRIKFVRANNTLAVTKDFIFPEGESVLAATEELPIGTYSIHILALGPKFPDPKAYCYHGLGSGDVPAVDIVENQTTTVNASIKPFQYSLAQFPSKVSYSSHANICFGVRMLSINTQIKDAACDLRKANTPMLKDWDYTQSLCPNFIQSVDTSDAYKVTTVLDMPGQDASYDFQVAISMRYWDYNNTGVIVLFPSIQLGEVPATVVVGEAQGSLDMNMIWEDYAE